MPTTVAINGFGRMGRLSLRVLFDRFPEMEVVAINEHAGTAKCAAHLLKYDSVHGRWDRDVDSTDSTIVVGTTVIPFTSSTNLEGLGWKDIHIDIVLECTGAYRTPAKLQSYFDQGCTKVIVACPVKEGALNVVYGCNDGQYDPATHNLLTAASCTTNAVAPVVKVLQEKIGIKHGQITTMHDTTNTQNVVDAPHKDLRRARANSMSLIPTTTGSATAITMIYPELKGKLNGLAVRVPVRCLC
jgi:glyceraldehyde 3-phosphate dehydrogenase